MSKTEQSSTVGGIIVALAQFYRFELGDFVIKGYLSNLKKYSPGLVERAAYDCMNKKKFMPKPCELVGAIELIRDKEWQEVQRTQPWLPEPPPTDSDRAFGSFVCKAFTGWMRSGFIKQQRDAGTFIDYDHSLFSYMAEHEMDQKHIGRLAATYPVDPRERTV